MKESLSAVKKAKKGRRLRNKQIYRGIELSLTGPVLVFLWLEVSGASLSKEMDRIA